MGSRLIRQWVSKPLLDVKRIHQRQEGVTHFYDDGLRRAEIRQALKPLGDLERLINRVVSGSGLPRDLSAIRETLSHLPGLNELLGPMSGRHGSRKNGATRCRAWCASMEGTSGS